MPTLTSIIFLKKKFYIFCSILLTLSDTVTRIQKPKTLTSRFTDWDRFRCEIDLQINLNVRLKSPQDLEEQTQQFIEAIRNAVTKATSEPKTNTTPEKSYPPEICNLIKLRRKARRTWHTTRQPADKNAFNRISNRLNRAIKSFNKAAFDRYLENLSLSANSNYSLWRATRRFKRPVERVSPLQDENGQWIRRSDEKVELFAKHLANTFQPHNSQTNVVFTPEDLPVQKISFIKPMEVAKMIDELNSRKSPGIDEISADILKGFSKKAVILLTYLFNASFRLSYIPAAFKIAKIIMLKKPDKPPENVTSYRPISLLPIMSKIFEKLLLKRLEPFLAGKIPDHQFGFRKSHSTIDQCHRVTTYINQALEQKKYCVAAFLDVAQAFDRVWHDGLLLKLSAVLPVNMCQLLRSYLENRTFRVCDGSDKSSVYPISASVPQGSVLGPVLYTLYTADIPVAENTFTATYADDTVTMAVGVTQAEATETLQRHLDRIVKWMQNWKIKLNERKAVHVTFALRKTNSQHHLFINSERIPQSDSARYLGFHLDSRLTWKHHIQQKMRQLKLKFQQMYWLTGRKSPLNLSSKRLLYLSVLRPIWTYGIEIWGCTSKSNRDIVQRRQNIILRSLTNARWFQRNDDIHADMKIKFIDEVIRERAIKHEQRLHSHVNIEAIQLLDNSQITSRLKRRYPLDLCSK